ncbi:MAG: SPFH domain-containing protein [Bacteroidota bacterium]
MNFMYLSSTSLTFLAIVCIFVISSLTLTIKIVSQSEQWMLERFGRFSRVLEPGIHFVIPYIDRIGFRISMREQVLDIPPQAVITKDNAMVTVDGVVFYRVFDSHKAAYMIQNLRFAITQLIMTNIRTVLGEMELDSTLSNRDAINNKLLATIDLATDPWGIQVKRVEIKDIQPPADIQEAMSRQMKAVREKRSTVTEAEGYRESAILRANGERESAILEAQGEKESVILQAKAARERAFLEAEAHERKAAAEAEAIRLVAEAMGKSKGQASQYFLSQKYIESLREMASSQNSKTVFMPIEATKVVSSLGSLAELGKELMEKETKKDKK